MELLGLDIGTSHIKAVSIERDKKNKLKRYSVSPSKGISQKVFSESDDDINELAKHIKEFLLNEEFYSKQVVAVLPDHRVFTKLITMPVISSGKDFESAIHWEAEQHLPHRLSDVYLKYTVLGGEHEKSKKSSDLIGKLTKGSGKHKDGMMDILLVAVPKHIVDKYLGLLNKAGLEPIGLEPASIATIRSTMVKDTDVPTIIADLGYSNVNFSLAANNSLRFIRTINFAISSVVRMISQELDVSPTQAAEYLYTYGLKEDELNGKIREIILPVLNIIIDELKKSIHFVEKRSSLVGTDNSGGIKRIILSGGGALIPNLMLYLVQELSIEIEYANPWETVDISSIKGDNRIDDYGPLFTAAVGAALKGE